ncbi:tryptophan-rich sensory protein [Anoxybacillus tepidamans]|uniref:Tryptophan-rich sensory protein n=1 Tax=Anoxybacteroides tepidamans TaxID=265948 RepID=A0A7W8IMI6_9BACL|nr:tryptophan-rich sensory protein [Anoxybacillus tepidamans]
MGAYEIYGFFLVILIYSQLFRIIKTKEIDYVYAIIPILLGFILFYTSIFNFIRLYTCLSGCCSVYIVYSNFY